jgi:hypothetical protein
MVLLVRSARGMREDHVLGSNSLFWRNWRHGSTRSMGEDHVLGSDGLLWRN